MSAHSHNTNAVADAFFGQRKPARSVTLARPAIHSFRQASATPKVKLEDVSLSYRTERGSRLLALDGINLQVRAGEFLCIVGPS